MNWGSFVVKQALYYPGEKQLILNLVLRKATTYFATDIFTVELHMRLL